MGNHYTAQRFIAAIPGTGGIVSALADRVGCDWHTAKEYIEEYATVGQAWSAERNKVTDKARHNIVKGIQGGDHQLSKWWLQSMDDDFIPKQKTEITGSGGGPVTVTYVNSWRHPTANAAPGPADGSEESG